MRVRIEAHYGAALLHDDQGKTFLVQYEGDMLEMLGEDWSSGDEIEISDEYEGFFE